MNNYDNDKEKLKICDNCNNLRQGNKCKVKNKIVSDYDSCDKFSSSHNIKRKDWIIYKNDTST